MHPIDSTRRGLWKLVPGHHPDLPYTPFPLVHSALFYLCTNHEDNHLLSPGVLSVNYQLSVLETQTDM